MADRREVRTFCRICAASCGIVVTADGEQIVSVRGDSDHPVSQGYTCSKGRALPAMHHHEDRLDDPALAGQAASWDETLDDLAARLRTVVDEHGPDAVAIYRSAGWAFDAAGRYFIDSFARALGTNQIYSSLTLDTPNKLLVADLMTGSPLLLPFPDRENARLVILVGQNPIVSHGHGVMWPNALQELRQIRASGGKVVVVDPRITESAAGADVHVQLLPGTDAALLGHLVREVLARRPDTEFLDAAVDAASLDLLRRCVEPFDAATTAARCGVPLATLAEVVELLVTTPRVATSCGTGVSMSEAPNAAEWLSWALNAVTGSLDRPGGVLFTRGFLRPMESRIASRPRVTGAAATSRPEFSQTWGELPAAVLNDEILSGGVRALLVFGGNPAKVFPDSDKTRAALTSLDVLAVHDVRRTETTDLATHLLAGTGQLERADMPAYVDGTFPIPFTQYGARVVEPAGQRRATWWIVSELGRKMGVRLPEAPNDPLDDDAVLAGAARSGRATFEQIKAAPSGIVADDAPEVGWVVPDRIPRGRLDLAPAELVDQLEAWRDAAPAPPGLALVNRRLPHQMNSLLREVASQQRRPLPTLLVHPQDAAAYHLTDGAGAHVRSRHGETTAMVEISSAMRPGVVSLPHGWSGPDVNQLTSDVDDLDPLTGMPRFSGIAVTLEPVLEPVVAAPA
ncbi:MAG: putative dehydrogenase [Acidimicrobiales bacterium]|nr:putative dehydrogenase [Acidimicrobiales bacterium]